jgi:nitrogen regulatory protein PII
MKLIIATLKPQMLDDVIFALHQIEDFPGATLASVKGIGKGFHRSDHTHVHVTGFDYPTYKRLEIVCDDEMCPEITRVLAENANTGNPDDGRIICTSIDEVIPITARD